MWQKLFFESRLEGQRCLPEDKDILIRSYRCWCFGLLMDWLNNCLKEDIKPTLKRLCELSDGTVGNFIARCRKMDADIY